MRKKFCIMMLAAVLLLSTLNISALYAGDDISVVFGGEQVVFEGQGPVIADGRTLVPVRGVFERAGFEVGWDYVLRQVTLTGTHTVIITVDSDIFTTNGDKHTLDVPAQIINDRTMLPIRAVLESVGFDVDWDDDARAVLISYEAVVPVIVPMPVPESPLTVEQTVYWVDGGTVWHTRSSCPTLVRSRYIRSGTTEQSGKERVCQRC